MKNLQKFYPDVPVIYGERGLSMSQAQRDAEAYKNENEKLLEMLKYEQSKVYLSKKEILTSSGVQTTQTATNRLMEISDFDVLPIIAKNNSKAAILRRGVALMSHILEEIPKLTNEKIAEVMGLEVPVLPKNTAFPKQAVKGNLSQFVEKDKIEELFFLATPELIEKIRDVYFRGLEVEALAAAYGKQLTEKGCAIREISKAPLQLATKQIETAGIIVLDTPVLGIQKSEFTQLEEKLIKEYEKYQLEKNGILKFIKDTAREMQRVYDTNHSVALQEYRSQYVMHSKNVAVFEAECERIKTELRQEASSLKILVA